MPLRVHAAIDDDARTGDVSGVIGSEESDRSGDQAGDSQSRPYRYSL